MEKLTELIIKTADETIPKSSGKPIRKKLPWWNEDCKNAHTLSDTHSINTESIQP